MGYREVLGNLSSSGGIGDFSDEISQWDNEDTILKDWVPRTKDWHDDVNYHHSFDSNPTGCNSRKILMIFSGRDSLSNYGKAIGLKDCKSAFEIQEKMAEIIGSDILEQMGVQHEALRSNAIDIQCKNVQLVQLLEHSVSDLNSAMVVLMGDNSKDEAKVIADWLRESTSELSSPIPLLYSYSKELSQELRSFSEEHIRTICSSGILQLSENNPTLEMNRFLLTLEQFIGNGTHNSSPLKQHNKEISFDVKSYFHEQDMNGFEHICGSITCGLDSISSTCKSIIESHNEAFKKSMKMLLPKEFFIQKDLQLARTAWATNCLNTALDHLNSNQGDRAPFDYLMAYHLQINKTVFRQFEKTSSTFDEWLAAEVKEIIKWDRKKLGNRLTTKFKDQNDQSHLINGAGQADNFQAAFDHCNNSTLFDGFNTLPGILSDFHPKYWSYIRNIFHLINSTRHEDPKGILPELKEKIVISKFPKITDWIKRNLILEEFKSFSQDGGVING
jgi:hypothetical protein